VGIKTVSLNSSPATCTAWSVFRRKYAI